MRKYFGLILIVAAACQTQPSVRGGERLLNSESDYLREHADNPVQWYEWSDEAFERAANENKPVIVSIGYASCYWCHEMERNVFLDSAVADVMNDKFISIKVDREQRPDIDQLFLHAAEVLNSNTGWPLNAFATTEGKPFTSVTYQSKEEWIALLESASTAWQKDKTKLAKQADDVEHNIALKEQYPFVTDTVLRHDMSAFLKNVDYWGSSLDMKNGGINETNKFYRPALISFMLQHANLVHNPEYETWITTTLDNAGSKAVYDSARGGFFRYATDQTWSSAHYEKMLYDNGQMVSVYSKAFSKTGNAKYRQLAEETLAFINKEMTDVDGTFYSSIDAQTDEERENKVNPKVYKQVITSWNAMMMTGYIDGYRSFGDSKYLEAALKNAEQLKAHITSDTSVYRSATKSLSKPEGFLDDYAWLAYSWINLYQVTYDINWLNEAKRVTDIALVKFVNPNDALFYYSTKNNLTRNTELFDTMIPSSNSVFTEVLLMLGEYYQDEKYTDRGMKALTKAISPFSVEGVYLANWARIAEASKYQPYEIAIVGDKALEYTRELQKLNLPPSIFLGGNEENLPLLESKKIEGETMIYVCKNRTCKFPVKTPKEAMKLISK